MSYVRMHSPQWSLMEIHFTVFGNHGTIDLFRSGSAQLTWKQMMMTGILSEQQMLQQKVCGDLLNELHNGSLKVYMGEVDDNTDISEYYNKQVGLLLVQRP